MSLTKFGHFGSIFIQTHTLLSSLENIYSLDVIVPKALCIFVSDLIIFVDLSSSSLSLSFVTSILSLGLSHDYYFF